MFPFAFYVQELRVRLFYLFFSWALSAWAISLYGHDFFFLFHLICMPFAILEHSSRRQALLSSGFHSSFDESFAPLSFLSPNFIFTDIPEVFVSFFLVALFGGIFFVFPFFLYQTWCFLVPSLSFAERIKLQSFFFMLFAWIYGTAWLVLQGFFPFFFDFFFQFWTRICSRPTSNSISSFIFFQGLDHELYSFLLSWPFSFASFKWVDLNPKYFWVSSNHLSFQSLAHSLFESARSSFSSLFFFSLDMLL